MKKNRGAALITVMIVVFIVMAIIANLSVTNFRVIKRLSNRQLIEQAATIANSAIDFGRAGLGTSAATSKVDTLKDIWAQPLLKTKIMENTYMSGYVVDEQSKFNINDLVINGRVNSNVLNQFSALLGYINLPQGLAYNIAYYIASPQYQSDIMQQYTSGIPAYRPAGRQFVDLSELVLVKGITPAIAQKLMQYVVAIPVSGFGFVNESAVESSPSSSSGIPGGIAAMGFGMGVNANTASAEVIAAKSGIQLPIAQRLISYRDSQPFQSTQELTTFLTSNGVSNTQNQGGTPLNLSGLGVTSNYFTVHAVIDNEDDEYRLVALVFRQNRSGQWPQILWQHPE